MVAVVLYGPIRDTVGQKTLNADGETVGEALETLFSEWPALEERVMDGAAFAPQINVLVDGRKLATLDNLETRLEGDETIQITAAMSGG